MASLKRPTIVVENDPFLRMLQLILSAEVPLDRMNAFADFFHHEKHDFPTWCEELRASAPSLGGATIKFVETTEDMRTALPDCDILVTEALPVTAQDIAAAPKLKIIQKFGTITKSIDVEAASTAGVKVLTLRRRANIACAEHAFALMLALGRRLDRFSNIISENQLAALGFPYKPFDRTHTPGSNWARIPGVRMLNESTFGIIGLGEIGRELALRANAFGMRILYYQRTQLSREEERALQVEYASVEALLTQSDWIVPQLPSGPTTKHFLNSSNLERIKHGAIIVNVSRADIIERQALIDGLRSQRIGGFGLDPQYATPGHDDDELLGMSNVILTPHIAAQPRFNALKDFTDLINNLSRETQR